MRQESIHDHPEYLTRRNKDARKSERKEILRSTDSFRSFLSVSRPPEELALTLSQDIDGSIYVGLLEGSLRHGEGSIFWPNGDILCGTFHHNTFCEGFQFKKKALSLHCSSFPSCKQGSRRESYDRSKVESVFIPLKLGQEVLISQTVLTMHSAFQKLLQLKKEWKCAVNQTVMISFAREPLKIASFTQFLASSKRWSNETQFQQESEYTNQNTIDFEKEETHIFGSPNSTHASAHDENYLQKEGTNLVRCSNRESIRDEVAHKFPAEVVFAFSFPMSTEVFNWKLFGKAFLAFFLPVFALPGFLCAPCAIDASEIEREFIVSGASLQRSFSSPYLSLYATGIGVIFELTALLVCIFERLPVGSSVNTTNIAYVDILFPVFLWVTTALVGGAYFGYRRIPHGLEHMNRELTAELTALAANVVDSKSKVCIYTWDETGREKEKNKWFRIKWMFLSALIAVVQVTITLILRVVLGYTLLNLAWMSKLVLAFSYISQFFFTLVITYYTLKALDMQRELFSKLYVLSKIAYLERKSLLNAGALIKEHFSCEQKVDVRGLKSGFIGWYTTRSLILCASPSANGLSRGAAFSVLLFGIFLESLATIAFYFYYSLNSSPLRSNTFFIASCGILSTWGVVCIHYLVTCQSIRRELQRHLYIMDVVSLYHKLKRFDSEGSGIIEKCRRIAETSEVSPKMFNFCLNAYISWAILLTVLVAMFLSVLSFID